MVKGIKFTSSACGDVAIIDNEKEFLKKKYSDGFSFGIWELKRTGCFKCLGWLYDFRPHLKKYLVKQYNNWSEEYAPNKTAIRKSTHGRIQRIVAL